MNEVRIDKRALSHERLRVYGIAIRFLSFTVHTLERTPKGYASLTDQWRRAALSIPLNIAEGAGKASRADSARFFTVARGSPMECGAIIDACAILGLLRQDEVGQGKQMVVSLAAMLSTLSRREVRDRSPMRET